MSKYIKLTPECIEECKKEFAQTLASGKFADGKVNFTKTLGTLDRKATIYFSEVAWLKMQTLIREFDKEVAWHGLAYRGEDPSKDEYYITDILVYPQEVTGATVTTDQTQYQTWLMQHEDDVFNNIRMQGHSHVNMATNPSAVDTSLYERLLDQLDDTMFYIFMIWNKRKDKTIKIYDLAKNVLFETLDVAVEVMADESGIEKFLADAKDMVKAKVVTPTYSGGYGNYTSPYGGGYGAHQPSQSTQYGNYSQPSAVAKQNESKTETKPVTNNNNSIKKKTGSRKGRRSQNAKGSEKRVVPYAYDYDDYDDYCDAMIGRGY